ncbi:MAG: prepilin-type N-terminal cleavage/methylation domain-containing protein [Planctomycetes bacterium]|nr:prepilin-type N-terminal cleavage/methylation domain-containing protein [Planctomycetota bacterium]
MQVRLHSRRSGFTLIEVMTAATIMASLQTDSYQGVMDRAKALKCQNNLRQIGQVLMMVPAPEAAFFPQDDPRTDPKSLLVLLRDKVPEEMFVCPTAPAALAEKGLTFLWNDRLNGDTLMAGPKTWVMIEMNCLAEKPVLPHSGKYHVLYSDGSVTEVTAPPKEILEALAKARKEQGSKAQPGRAAEPVASAGQKAAPTPASGGQSPTPPSARTVEVQADQAPVYLDQKVIANLPKGQKLEVVEVRGDWIGVKVNVHGTWNSGWVRKSDVRE